MKYICNYNIWNSKKIRDFRYKEIYQLNNKEIKVSVICLAFNHEKYIKQSIESILSQKTDFDFEIIVNDDASTDGTVAIIRSYQEKYPDIIKPIFHEENQFSKNKGHINEPVKKAQGKYLAFAYGDDYWCDENKLQLQYDLMESNKDVKICFHKVKTYFEKNGKFGDYYYPWKALSWPFKGAGYYSSNELIALGNIPSGSIMIHKSDYIPQIDCTADDFYCTLSMAIQGQGYCIDKTMMVYRYTEASTSYTEKLSQNIEFFNKETKQVIKTCERMNQLSENKYNSDFEKVIKRKQQTLLKLGDMEILGNLKENFTKYIYGTGVYGKICYNELTSCGIKVDGFVVSDCIDTANELKGLPVYHLSEILEQKNIYLIISLRKSITDMVVKQLENSGFKDFCIGITEEF